MKLPSGEYFIYLRKSRADLEAEARGEGETLAKHRKALFRLAREKGINVTQVYEEIVSGESLFHRPQMLKLLEDMETNAPKGVLVMDMDRLGRGNMQEQGLILDTFRRHNVLIVTPAKTYDLNDESDELMTEIQTLFARQELRMITRRMQRGRVASVEEGNYIGTRPPYGYLIHQEGRERFLVPHPEQAPIVKQIFQWYANEEIGASKIAARLNEMGIRTYTGRTWTSPSVLVILKNEVYIGLIQWKKREQKKSRTPGKRRDTRTRDKSEWISVRGKHEPLVNEELFRKAQDRLKSKYHVPYQLINGVTNPLAGLIKCGKCGYSMVLRPYTKQAPHIKCYNRFCDNKSSRVEYVETKLIQALEEELQHIKIKWSARRKKKDSTVEIHEQVIQSLERELKELEQQKERLYDFLERGIYSEDVFLERSQNLQSRIEQTQQAIMKAHEELHHEQERVKAQKDIIPNITNVIRLYKRSKDPARKNALLKSIMYHAEYRKEKHQRLDDFELKIFLKIHR